MPTARTSSLRFALTVAALVAQGYRPTATRGDLVDLLLDGVADAEALDVVVAASGYEWRGPDGRTIGSAAARRVGNPAGLLLARRAA